MCVITETWLKDTNHDNCWLQTMGLNNGNYRINSVNRKGLKRGGLAIIWNAHSVNCKLVKAEQKATFEYAIWNVKLKNKSLHLVGVYHPPCSDPRYNTAAFCDEFCDLVSDISMVYENLLYLGDYNIHVNNVEDQDAVQFLQMTEGLGLDQEIKNSTHQSGNTLDLIFTECIGSLKLVNTRIGNYISDHNIIISELNFALERKAQEQKYGQKFNPENIGNFMDNLDLSEICNTMDASLDSILDQFEYTITEGLNKFIPITTRKP